MSLNGVAGELSPMLSVATYTRRKMTAVQHGTKSRTLPGAQVGAHTAGLRCVLWGLVAAGSRASDLRRCGSCWTDSPSSCALVGAEATLPGTEQSGRDTQAGA